MSTSHELPPAKDPSDERATPTQASRVLYRERQWIPSYWWIYGLLFVLLVTYQVGNNRSLGWYIGTFVVVGALTFWALWSLSGTRLRVEEDSEGVRWLHVQDAMLPHDVVSRSIAVPKSARQNAMGRQLDPAAFVSYHAWVPDMVMVVLDDPNDPTPYWLISTQDPRAILESFVPDQAASAVRTLAKPTKQ